MSEQHGTELILRGVLESQEMVIFALDREYRYLAFNRFHVATMRQIWGVEIERGVSMLNYIGRQDDRIKAVENFDRALRGEHFTLVETYGSEEQERRHYENRYSPIFDDRGLVIGLTVFVADVTDRLAKDEELEGYRRSLEKKVQEGSRQLQSAERELHESEKLKSLGLMAGGIAHDFNNLLTGILGCAELALEEYDAKHDEESLLHEIRAAAQRGAELTGQMLAYSSQGSLRREPFELNTVIREMQKLLKVIVKDRGHLSFDLCSGGARLFGDEGQFHQLILNTVKNAAEALPPGEGGRIHVQTAIKARETIDTDGALVLGAIPSKSQLLVCEVVDDGAGMSPELQRRIFEPFFSHREGGSGLGLAAVHGIVKRHDGAVVLRSQPGEGTSFQFLFALEVSNASMRVPLDDVPVSHAGSSVTCSLLVVDDDVSVRSIVSRMVKRLGYTPILASSGEEAIRLHETHGEGVHGVLMDLSMPGMSGAEAVLALREQGLSVPVVAMSGYAPEGLTLRDVRREIGAFISKPFDMRRLSSVLEKQLRTRGEDTPRSRA